MKTKANGLVLGGEVLLAGASVMLLASGEKPVDGSTLSLSGKVSFGAEQELPGGAINAAGNEGADGGANGAGEKPKRVRPFDMMAYTGGAIFVGGMRTPVVFDLAGLDVGASSRPIYLNHVIDTDYLLGQTTDVVKSANSLRVKGNFFSARAKAKEVMELQDDGFQWQASVGVSARKFEYVEPGQTASANGMTFSGPLYVVRAGTLTEVSFTELGADDRTSARIAAGAAKGMAMDFVAWLAARGLTASALSDEQKKTFEADFAVWQASQARKAEDVAKANAAAAGNSGGTGAGGAGGGGADPVADLRARSAAELERQTAITALAAGAHGEIVAKAIREGWSVDKTELEILRANRPAAGTVPMAGNGAGRRLMATAAAIAAAVCLTAGMGEKAAAEGLPEDQKQQVMNAATSREMRGFGLQALMSATIDHAGEHGGYNRSSQEFVAAALRANQKLEASANISASGFSTVSLSGILSNVANKQMLASYTAVETVWDQFCGVGNNPNFKPVTRYRLDSQGAYRQIPASGEIKNSGLSEASYTSKIDTYGTMITLTRKMMIDDDLGTFVELPALTGRMAALRLEEMVFALLLGNTGSFFAAGNNNLISGASSALSIAAVSTAKQKFRDMLDANKKPIGVTPDRILVGTNNEVLANQIFDDKEIRDTTANKVSSITNPHYRKFKVIVSTYINNTGVTDQDNKLITGTSDTKWWLFGDPAVRAALRVAFLQGNRTPTLESAVTDFTTLGMQWRSYHDFGAGFEETSAAVQSAGA